MERTVKTIQDVSVVEVLSDRTKKRYSKSAIEKKISILEQQIAHLTAELEKYQTFHEEINAYENKR